MIGVFADIPNTFYNCRKKYNGRLNYEKLLSVIAEGGNVFRAYAYGSQIDDEAKSFISCLKYIGFEPKWYQLQSYIFNGETKYKRMDLSLIIAMDVVRVIEKLTTVVLVSSDPNLAPLVYWAKEKGAKTIVFGCNVSKQLKESCDHWNEIREDFLDPLE